MVFSFTEDTTLVKCW